MSLLQLTSAQLRRAADLKERLDALTGELQALLGSGSAAAPKKLHWTQTPEGQARLARSMRKSWQIRGRKQVKAALARSKKLHWTQTPEGQIKMIEIRRRRWLKR